MSAATDAPRHRTAWEDDGMAGLRSCGPTVITQAVVVERGETTECPVCGLKLTLHWDVRIEVAP